jgi:hypothetical protein
MNFVTDLLSDITDDLGGQSGTSAISGQDGLSQGKIFSTSLASLERSAPVLGPGNGSSVVEGMGCVQRWYGCSSTEDCCAGTQCRVGDRRCLSEADFNWAKNADHEKGDAGALDRNPDLLYRPSKKLPANCKYNYETKSNWNWVQPLEGGGGPEDRFNYSNLESAKKKCSSIEACKAITHDAYGFNLRTGTQNGPSPGYNTWIKDAKCDQSKDKTGKTELPSMKNLICPIDFPFMSTDPGVCYNNPNAAEAGSGPCGSWCALGDSASSSGVEAVGCGWPNDSLMCKNKSQFKSLRYVMVNVDNPNSFGGMMIAGEKWRSTNGFSEGGGPAEAKGAPYVWDDKNHMYRATPPEDQFRLWYNGGRYHGPDSPDRSGPSKKGWCIGGGFTAKWQTPGQFLEKAGGDNEWGSIMFFLPSDNEEDPSGDYVRADEYFKGNASDMQWVNDLNQNTAWGVLSEIGGMTVRQPEPLEGPPHVSSCPGDLCEGKDGWYCGGGDVSESNRVCQGGEWRSLDAEWGEDWYAQFKKQKRDTILGLNEMSDKERKEIAKDKADYSNAEAAVKSGAAVVASTQQFIEDQNNQIQQDASRLGADFNASGGDFGLGTKSEVTDAVKAKLQELDSALTAFEAGSGKSGSLSSGSYSQLQSIAKQIDSAISQDDGADKAYTRAWDQSRQHAAKLMDRYQAVKLRDEQEMPVSMEEVEGQLESSELKHNASFYGWALWAALVAMLVGITVHFTMFRGSKNMSIIVMGIVAIGLAYVGYNMYLLARKTQVLIR